MVSKEDICSVLAGFDAISLEESLDSALMNRVEQKFFFSKDILTNILEYLKRSMVVLEIGESRILKYSTKYLDTKNLQMYLDHHNRRPSRYKLRFRTYLSTNHSFFEVKQKTNKKRTIKNRIPVDSLSQDQEMVKKYIAQFSPYASSDLLPSMEVRYERITLLDTNSGDRITIDSSLETEGNGNKKKFNNLCILELKQSRINRSSLVFEAMRKVNVRARRISKYCLGVTHCYDVKNNLFRAKLKQIEHIENREQKVYAI